jgi:hypothetical protein
MGSSPLVWCIGAHLVEERKRACDEVLSCGSHPEVYADGILNVCKVDVQSPPRVYPEYPAQSSGEELRSSC